MPPQFRVILLAAALTLNPSLFAVAAAADVAAEPRTARWLIDHQHWKQARARLEADRKARPDDPAVLGALAEVRARFGDLEGAQALAERAVQLAPNDAQVRETLADVLGERAGEAGALKALGLAKRFRKEAEAAIALDPKRIGPRIGLMEFHMRAPGIAGGDKKKARPYADEIARLDPARGELAYARLAQLGKDTTKVEGHYRRAVELDPQNIEARMNLAGWLVAPWRARTAEAEQHAKAARQVSPDRAGPITLLAVLYAQQARWADLEALLAEAAADCPDNRGAWYQAGRIALTGGSELARAERWFRHYLEQEPEPGNPSLAHAHWRLGQVLEKLGRRSEAVAQLESALKLKPDLDEAKKELKRLRG